MIVDVTFNHIKKLVKNDLLLCEKAETVELYYVNQSPAIFRCVLRKPNNETDFNLMMQQMPKYTKVLNVITDSELTNMLLMQLKQNGIQPTIKS